MEAAAAPAAHDESVNVTLVRGLDKLAPRRLELPAIRAREQLEEEDWQNAILELRKYRKWQSFGAYR